MVKKMASAIDYLKKLRKDISGYIRELKALENKDQDKKLGAILKRVVKTEKDLRKEQKIDDKYSGIRNQIQNLVDKDSDSLKNPSSNEISKISKPIKKIEESEQRVYVHLFNAQGAHLFSWHKLLIPSSLEEHSINRPIYTNENYLKKILRSKQNIAQHGYLAVIIDKVSIIQQYNAHKEYLMDSNGYELLRLKENAIRLEKIEYFWHEGKKYHVSPQGDLTLIVE